MIKSNTSQRVKFILILFFSFGYTSTIDAQKLFPTGSVSYQARIEDNQTYQQAKEAAIIKAQIKAIEERFGRIIIQGNSTFIENIQSGERVESTQDFNSISNSLVKGEWIKDKNGYPIDERIIHNNESWIKVTVNGFIREIIETPFSCIANTLNCNKTTCHVESFKNNSDFFFHFKSPEEGFISIYLDDIQTEQTYRLLPYTDAKENCFKVHGNKDYIFFDTSNNSIEYNGSVDELTLSLENGRSIEQYKVYVLFSKNDFTAPILENNTVENPEKHTLPNSLTSEDFQKWIQKLRTYHKIELKTSIITLKK